MSRTIIIALALACTTAYADTNEEQAKAHFTVGKGYQDLGEFAKAAEEFKVAYALDPRPEMLFNIAQAYRFGNDKRQALDYFQRYLAAQPDGNGATEAKQHIDELTKELAEQPQPPTQPTPVPPPPTPQPQPREPQTTTSSSPGLRIAGLVTLGVGAVGVGLGVKFGLDARSATNTINSRQTGWLVSDHTAYDDGQRANRNMYISYIAGGALLATGGVLYWLGSRTHVTATADAHSASIAMSGRF